MSIFRTEETIQEEDDLFDAPSIGRPLIKLLAETLEIRDPPNSWLPAGLTLLGGKTKSGKSTLAEQIAEEVSVDRRVLYLALEYNKRVAKARFDRFKPDHKIHILLESEIKRMGEGGEDQLEELLYKCNLALVIIDILAKIKRRNAGSYDAEYVAMTEIKELVDKYDVDCLVLTHSGKPSPHDGDDPFDKIIGSTALQGVPDNLMVLVQNGSQTALHTKGRLIYPSKKLLYFDGTGYSEKTSLAAEYEDKAPVQAQVLRSLEEGPKTSKQLVSELGKDKGQISHVCSSLSEARKITQSNRTAAWELVTQDLLT